jgi:hypothetical protein
MRSVEEREANRAALRSFVRTRDGYMEMRKALEGRLGLKADGTPKKDFVSNVPHGDRLILEEHREAIIGYQKGCERDIKRLLKSEPLYTEWLVKIPGVDYMTAGYIIGEYSTDPQKLKTVSSMWQFAGLALGPVKGRKKVGKGKKAKIVVTDTLIRGDRLTKGFLSPFNQKLRSVLLGSTADSMIKCAGTRQALCPYRKFYVNYKTRLENSDREVSHYGKKVPWKDVNKQHRHDAAKRYMIKMFLKDVYNIWLPMLGREPRPPFDEERLEREHHGNTSIPYYKDSDTSIDPSIIPDSSNCSLYV